MCGIKWCQAEMVSGGSETFKLAAFAPPATAPGTTNNLRNIVMSEYVFNFRLSLFKPIPLDEGQGLCNSSIIYSANCIMMVLLSAEACDPAISTVLTIPSMSYDGISTLPQIGDSANVAIATKGDYSTGAIASTMALASSSQAFVSQQCGGLFGAWGTHATIAMFGRIHNPDTVPSTVQCLVCKCITLLHVNHLCLLQRGFSRSPWVLRKELPLPGPNGTDSNLNIPR